MQTEILEASPQLPLRVYAVWDRHTLDSRPPRLEGTPVFEDRRVTHVWSADGVVREWYGEHPPVTAAGDLPMDAFFLYTEVGAWENAAEVLVAWGELSAEGRRRLARKIRELTGE